MRRQTDYIAMLVRKVMDLPCEKKAPLTESLTLDPKECDILDYLMEHQNLLAREISEYLQTPRHLVCWTLVKLREKGYVGTSEPAYKGWARPWHITDKGKRAAITPQRWAV